MIFSDSSIPVNHDGNRGQETVPATLLAGIYNFFSLREDWKFPGECCRGVRKSARMRHPKKRSEGNMFGY